MEEEVDDDDIGVTKVFATWWESDIEEAMEGDEG